jgi:hypothetical protein
VQRSASFFRGDRAPLMDASMARRILVTLLAALESDRVGAPIDVE